MESLCSNYIRFNLQITYLGLMPKSREIYQQICKENYIPWYASFWWLNATCKPENWEAILQQDDKDNYIGALPVFHKKKFGLSLISQAPFTAYSHFWMKPATSKKAVLQNNRTLRITQELVKKIPPSRICDLMFDESLQNVLPFYWAGFQTNVRYTYQFPDLSHLPEIHRAMESSARTHIRKAQGFYEVTQNTDASTLLNLVKQSMARKHIAFRLMPAELEDLQTAIEKNASLKIYSAVDQQQQTQAAIAIVQDQKRASFWLSGSSETGRKTSAIYLLLWTAIKEAAKSNLLFDFEGSMAPSVETLFRSFGASRTPYYRVIKTKPKFLSLLRS